MFGDVRWAWLWPILRLYLGWPWLDAGLGKLSNPAWTGSNAGAAIAGFVQGALQKTGGEHLDIQGWYAWFLQNVVLPNAGLWSYLVTFGEILVGIAECYRPWIRPGARAWYFASIKARRVTAGQRTPRSDHRPAFAKRRRDPVKGTKNRVIKAALLEGGAVSFPQGMRLQAGPA